VKMRMLVIDTCGAEGSVAASEGGSVVAEERLPGRSASESLIPVIRQMMQRLGWELGELSAIGVVHGPGSFTGVRVGLSAAKGLSEAGGVPLVAVSRLALLAEAAGEDEARVCALLDAGRGEFYCGVYEGRKKVSEALVAADEISSIQDGASAVVACEARVAEVAGATLVEEPSAASAVPLIEKRIKAREFEDVATIDANYLRRTDLEIFAKNAALTAAKDAGC
jgi:tRNA threonylcarbamoyladenosine biosynthesis protein TsaB